MPTKKGKAGTPKKEMVMTVKKTFVTQSENDKPSYSASKQMKMNKKGKVTQSGEIKFKGSSKSKPSAGYGKIDF